MQVCHDVAWVPCTSRKPETSSLTSSHKKRKGKPPPLSWTNHGPTDLATKVDNNTYRDYHSSRYPFPLQLPEMTGSGYELLCCYPIRRTLE